MPPRVFPSAGSGAERRARQEAGLAGPSARKSQGGREGKEEGQTRRRDGREAERGREGEGREEREREGEEGGREDGREGQRRREEGGEGREGPGASPSVMKIAQIDGRDLVHAAPRVKNGVLGSRPRNAKNVGSISRVGRR